MRSKNLLYQIDAHAVRGTKQNFVQKHKGRPSHGSNFY